MASRYESLKPLIARGVGHVSGRVAVRGSGSWVETTDGRKFLDFTSGIGVTNTGHSHPKVVAAAQKQLSEMVHCQVNCVWNPRYLELAEALQKVMPHDSLDSFMFVNSGAEAVENAVKIARVATGREVVIALQGGFHGRTNGTMALTTSKYVYRAHMGPLMPGVMVAPFPYCHRCEIASKPNGSCCNWPLAELKRLLKQSHHPSEIAAVILEPVLGEGGYVPAPAEYMHGLRQLCDEHGILLILDEVQTGFGRTGEMFAASLTGVRPDLLVMAKGLASGMPISAVAGRSAVMNAPPPGTLGGTYAGNAVACAAALASLDVYQSEGLVQNAKTLGHYMTQRLKALQSDLAGPIADVRGPGLMIGVEFDDARVPAGFANKVVAAAEEEGLFVLSAGSFETLRLIPPLVLSKSEADLGLDMLEKSIRKSLQ